MFAEFSKFIRTEKYIEPYVYYLHKIYKKISFAILDLKKRNSHQCRKCHSERLKIISCADGIDGASYTGLCEDCGHLFELQEKDKYEMRDLLIPCSVCGDYAELYKHGCAGYIVICDYCGAHTEHHEELRKAVWDWNDKKIIKK